jgi:hypothetical protein
MTWRLPAAPSNCTAHDAEERQAEHQREPQPEVVRQASLLLVDALRQERDECEIVEAEHDLLAIKVAGAASRREVSMRRSQVQRAMGVYSRSAENICSSGDRNRPPSARVYSMIGIEPGAEY